MGGLAIETGASGGGAFCPMVSQAASPQRQQRRRGDFSLQTKWHQSTAGFTEGFDTMDLQEAKALLERLEE